VAPERDNLGHGVVAWVTAGGPPEGSASEREHPSVRGNNPIPVNVSMGAYAQRQPGSVVSAGLVAARRTVKHGVAEAEPSAVVEEDVVPVSGGSRDDRCEAQTSLETEIEGQ
jgi:hypothetical protein